MTEEINGCVHLIMKDGKIINVFTHLDKLPKEGVVHLKGNKIYSFDEFKKSHPIDHDELNPKEEKVIISTFDLPPEYEKLRKAK